MRNIPYRFQPYCKKKSPFQQVVERIDLSKILTLILIILILGLNILPPSVEEKTKAISSWTAIPTISLEDKPFSSAFDLVETEDGGFALLGRTNTFGNDSTAWLLKTDSNGTLEWNRTYFESEIDVGRCALIQTTDGGYAFVGYTTSSWMYSGWDISLVKTDTTGMVLWNQTLNDLGAEYATDLIQTPNNEFIVAGTSSPYCWCCYNGPCYSWLVKTNAEGLHQWNNTYGTGVANALVQTMDEGFAFTATSTSSLPSTGRGIPLVKTNNQGSLLWNYTYGRPINSEDSCLIQTTQGDFVLIGTNPTSLFYDNDLWLVKVSSDGQVQWDQTFQDSCWVWLSGLLQSSDRGYAFIGSIIPDDWDYRHFGRFKSGNFDIQLVKTDVNGKIQWQQTYGGNHREEVFTLIHTNDGGFAFAGATNSFGISELCGDFYDPQGIHGPYGFALWLVKVDAGGNIEWMQTYGGFELVEEVRYETISYQTVYGFELHLNVLFLIVIVTIFSKTARKK